MLNVRLKDKKVILSAFDELNISSSIEKYVFLTYNARERWV